MNADLYVSPTTKIHTLPDIKHLHSAWVVDTASYVVADCVMAHVYLCVVTFFSVHQILFPAIYSRITIYDSSGRQFILYNLLTIYIFIFILSDMKENMLKIN
jgi:hypothetical protein